MSSSAPGLDAEELFHLALNAINNGDHEGAIDKLKRALALAPNDARLHFLLGAEYAEIGMQDRAHEYMTSALVKDPQLHPARFQLGMLELLAGRMDEAKRIWTGLDVLGPKNSMVLYKTALLKFEENVPEEGIQLLNQAMAAETDNAALRKEIEKTLRRAEERLTKGESPQMKSVEAAKAPASELLSRYDEAGDTDKPAKRRH